MRLRMGSFRVQWVKPIFSFPLKPPHVLPQVMNFKQKLSLHTQPPNAPISLGLLHISKRLRHTGQRDKTSIHLYKSTEDYTVPLGFSANPSVRLTPDLSCCLTEFFLCWQFLSVEHDREVKPVWSFFFLLTAIVIAEADRSKAGLRWTNTALP